MKPLVSNPSLSQMALTSQGSLRQGFGTIEKSNWNQDAINHVAKSAKLSVVISSRKVPEQLKPFPTVNGARHIQMKFLFSKFSLWQSALGSQGSDRQGSGTEQLDIQELS